LTIAACRHALAEYRAELSITERWRDSAAPGWGEIRARALAALGREREVMELYRGTTRWSVDSVAEQQLQIATELTVHGSVPLAKAIAESLLTRLEVGPDSEASRAESIARANRLLGRARAEREALEHVVHDQRDTVGMLETQARIAVLRADTVDAARIDSALAEQSGRRLRAPWARGRLILARAHLAAGFGRQEDAVAHLHDARSRAYVEGGGAFAFQHDLELLSLRGYPPFDALLRPAN
jgi:hypothetical protein